MLALGKASAFPFFWPLPSAEAYSALGAPLPAPSFLPGTWWSQRGLVRLCLPGSAAEAALRRSGFGRGRAAGAEDSATALLESVTVASVDHLAEQATDGFYVGHQGIEFRQFAPRQLLPALGGASDVSESEEELADFFQAETQLAGALNDGEPIEDGGVVAPLPAAAGCRRQQSDLLVIPDGRGPQANLPRDLGDSEAGHPLIVKASAGGRARNLQIIYGFGPCLKVDFKL